MEEYYMTTVESAVDDGTIAFRNEDGTRLSEAEHIRTVEQILDMIAQDSPTDRVKRLVQMSKDVYNCKRKKGESFPRYAARFQSLAKIYISYAGTSDKGQDEQNFAMILLENAKLDPTTYNNIIKELVVERKDEEIKITTQVEVDAVNNIKKATIRIGEIFNSIAQTASGSDLQPSHKITNTIMSELIHLQTTLIVNTKSITLPKKVSKLREKLRYSITLKKTVHALQVLLTDHNGELSQNEKPDDDAHVKKIGTMMGGRNSGYRPRYRHPNSRRRDHDRRNSRSSYRNGRYNDNGYNKKRRRSHDASEDETEDGYNSQGEDSRRPYKKKKNVFNRIVFSSTGSSELQEDLNPIIDPGAPTSTGGITEAAQICELLGIPLKLEPPKERYLHGWGQECLGAKQIVSTWDITVYDCNRKPTTLSFDLVNGSSPLVIGLDVGQYSDTINISDDPRINIRRPDDNITHSFKTYIAPEMENEKCIRQRMELFPRKQITSLLSNLFKRVQANPKAFAKQVHRYTHVHPEQLKYLCNKDGILTPSLTDAIENVDSACEICVRHGRPLPSKKISLSHVNEAFNEEVQIDFTFITIHAHQTNNTSIIPGKKYNLMNITDTGSSYSECESVQHRNIDTIISMYDRIWICQHGASKKVSAGDEYHRRRLVNFFNSHNIEFKPRPTRRHNKTGIVERKNGIIKHLIRRIATEKSNDSMDTIIARATLFSNLFSGSHILSSFELARGYQPSILGIPASSVSQELLDAQTEQAATRALQRVLRSRTPNTPTPGMFNTNDDVWFWYASSKNNEPNEWVKAKVIQAQPHYLEARRIKNGQPCKGPTMKPAYEDVRIAPKGELAQTLMAETLEEVLGQDDHEEQGVDNTNEQNTLPRNVVSSLMTQKKLPKGPKDDIGEYADIVARSQQDIVATLQSERARILEDMYEHVGSHQVSRHKLDQFPPWILDDAFAKEFESNWADAYTTIPERDVPRNANVITSHVVYKVKTEETGERKLKGRIVPHGNYDDEKDSIRKDSSTAQLSVIRLLLSIVTFLGFRLATADIKGAYLQSGPIQRDIYVRPPREWMFHKDYIRGVLWKLLKLPYGIVEAGRQWQKTVEEWMLSSYGLERLFGLSQLFIKRDGNGKIALIIAKVTDDFLIGGRTRWMKQFLRSLRQRFTVGKVVMDAKIHFNGCEIVQDQVGHIRMSMHRYLDKIRPITISRSRHKQRTEKANDDELRQYRSMAGTILYLGNGVLPQASFVVSLMQQRTASFKVAHLIDANKMLKELLVLKPWITFLKPSSIVNITYTTFSDAAHTKDRDYGQTGIISGLRIESTHPHGTLYHPIDWTSHKQHRVSHSPYGAEILAAATGDDRGFYYKSAINCLFPYLKLKHELIVDSKALYQTITTLHEGAEYRLRPTIQRLRNSFESQELDTLRWIPGPTNIADALTKRNLGLYAILNDLCHRGIFNTDIDSGYKVDSATWL